MNSKEKVVAKVENLHLDFYNRERKNFNKVIRGVSFELYQGEILALIGESGSGKSVVTSTLIGLQGSNSKITQGKIVLNGINITNFTNKEWDKLKLRGRVISQVLNDQLIKKRRKEKSDWINGTNRY